jgi:hypothetical protein
VVQLSAREYDEGEIVARLSLVDRHAKSAFAASCAQYLLPLFERYAHAIGGSEMAARLSAIVAATWEVADGAERDVAAFQAEAESMVPSDDDDWILETGYGQSAAAAAAYAIRTWLTDDPQEAAWAARQVYEVADYAALQSSSAADLNVSDDGLGIAGSAVVQSALATLDRALSTVESSQQTWDSLRADASACGRIWAADLP